MIEVLDEFSRRGTTLRAAAVDLAKKLRAKADVIFVECTLDHYLRALEKYRLYDDKSWSLTDCSSMVVMEDFAITDALTHDGDFEQAGFIALMRPRLL
jgi:predicted nucleic acid-binding protein